ncbi:MAG: hypothetical protein E6R08_00245 [Nevskiaceae bacterium]|nr:MAG: hypothetical protein E6R08_00245 [Nevskiaceae bacterium]
MSRSKYLAISLAAALAEGAMAQASTAPSNDAPAWVQAIGSVVAIVVAILVPWWLHAQARNDAKATADTRARVVASGLVEWIIGLDEVVRPAAECFESHSKDEKPHEEDLSWRRRLNQIYVPSDDQFLEVAVMWPGCAVLLARARTRIWQARSCLEDKANLTTQEFDKAAVNLRAALPYLDQASKELKSATRESFQTAPRGVESANRKAQDPSR